MANTTEYSTAAERAYRIICDAILSGALPQGQKLSRRNMAKLTGVSIIPVIEALHRLENEGLVESRPHWGSRVVQPTHEFIRDKYALREAVECQVVRMLCGTVSDAQIDELLELATEIDAMQQSGDMDTFWDKHYFFHLRMAQFTNCPSLVGSLHRINLFYLLQRAELEAQQILNTIPHDNHERVVHAIAEGDPINAEEEMRIHVYRSGLISREEVHGSDGQG